MTTVGQVAGAPGTAVVRRARRTARRAFRPRRSWPAFIAAVLVLAVAVLAGAAAVSAVAGAPLRVPVVGDALDRAAGMRWRDTAVLVAAGGAALVGLVLLVSALLPGRARWTALRTDDPDLVVGLSRSALRRAVAAAARGVSGVRGVRATVRRRAVRVRVDTELRDRPDLRDEVAEAVEERLDELVPLRRPKVRVRVRTAKA
ncbi:DUF6286 domain-containing protein [Nocardiopsis sp. RSe5-2]|uniref:DUF6286 domain-containing protein n=1 Tax=Nocardiopsis endophytica TaxID=3018445 RepID=A0ABT4UDA6_9ACTN|nr:DUF6286 domain-containing protein [Nocardiopsis endophytica]MDA2814946.1 DUF6286 domain-containing protein [Nocardiopsis endophytica]